VGPLVVGIAVRLTEAYQFDAILSLTRIPVQMEFLVGTGRSHDESVGDPHDGQSDAEKFKHIRADQQRAEQQEEAVDGDP
jgi:hypothetical protein